MNRYNPATNLTPHRVPIAAACLGTALLAGAGFYTYGQLLVSVNDKQNSRSDRDLSTIRQLPYAKADLGDTASQRATGGDNLFSLAIDKSSVSPGLHISPLSKASGKPENVSGKRTSEIDRRPRLHGQNSRSNSSESKYAGGIASYGHVVISDEAEVPGALNSGHILPEASVFQTTPVVSLAPSVMRTSIWNDAAGAEVAGVATAEAVDDAGLARGAVDTDGREGQISSDALRFAGNAPPLNKVEGNASPHGHEAEMLAGALISQDPLAADADGLFPLGAHTSSKPADQVVGQHGLAPQDALADRDLVPTEQSVEHPSTSLTPRINRPSGSNAVASEPTVSADQTSNPPTPVIASASGSLPAFLGSMERGAVPYVQHTPVLTMNGLELGALTVRAFANGQISVHLGTLLSLFKWKLRAAEFERLSGAKASDQFVSIEQLRDAGFDISYDSKRERLTMDLR